MVTLDISMLGCCRQPAHQPSEWLRNDAQVEPTQNQSLQGAYRSVADTSEADTDARHGRDAPFMEVAGEHGQASPRVRYEIWKYCQSTSKVHAQVLQNLRVREDSIWHEWKLNGRD